MLGFAILVAAVDLKHIISELYQRSWLQREDFSHQLQRSMARGEQVWNCTLNLGSELGKNKPKTVHFELLEDSCYYKKKKKKVKEQNSWE